MLQHGNWLEVQLTAAVRMVSERAISIIFVVTTEIVVSVRLNPKGPTHESYAVRCLEEVARNNFFYIDEFGDQREEQFGLLMLTVLTTFNMTSPGYGIQQNFIKKLNILSKWNLEIADHLQNKFDSYSYQFGEETKRVFVLDLKSEFVTIVVDSLENFETKLQVLTAMKSYNSRALYLIYFSTKVLDFESKVDVISEKLLENLIFNCLILIPKTLNVFNLYQVEICVDSPCICGQKSQPSLIDICENGKMQKSFKYYKIERSFGNCTIEVVANAIEPFVIDDDEGIEIELLGVIGKNLNITFDVTIDDDDLWGVKLGEFWTNGLGLVDNKSCIGIGNMAPTPEYIPDFDFTKDYYREELVWIVPIAQFVPKWRVLTVIFTLELWGVCLALLISSTFLLFFTSRFAKEIPYNSISNDWFFSLQLLVGLSIFRQPRHDLVRIVFLSIAILSIIIAAVYTSSLINYLTHAQREAQISTIEEVLSNRLKISGFSSYRDIFNVTDDETSQKVFDIYQTDPENSDDIDAYLRQVAAGATCTVFSKLYVNYLISEMDEMVTRDERPSVFVLKEKIFSYALSIVTKKGYPFRDRFNDIIRYVDRGGLIQKIAKKYVDNLEKMKVMEEEDDSVVQRLSMDHLQGAFAIIALGYTFGVAAFLLEVAVYLVVHKKRN